MEYRCITWPWLRLVAVPGADFLPPDIRRATRRAARAGARVATLVTCCTHPLSQMYTHVVTPLLHCLAALPYVLALRACLCPTLVAACCCMTPVSRMRPLQHACTYTHTGIQARRMAGMACASTPTWTRFDRGYPAQASEHLRSGCLRSSALALLAYASMLHVALLASCLSIYFIPSIHLSISSHRSIYLCMQASAEEGSYCVCAHTASVYIQCTCK
jgi:hypothetical protein